MPARWSSGAIRALLASDKALAQSVISDDAIMDAKQRELDDSAITLIAKRQPMAQDLRAVVGAIRMAGDLERDRRPGQEHRQARRRRRPSRHCRASCSHSIDAMAQLVLAQVHGVVDALCRAPRPKACRQLRADDEKIDVQYTAVFRELLTYMMEDPRNITACTHLLFCAKNLERIGDHVTNIAENAYYVVTGTQLPPTVPSIDETTATCPPT